MTPADFGIIAIGMVVAAFSDMLVDGSFSMVLIQRRKIDPDAIGATLVLSVALATLFSAGVFLSAGYIDRTFNFPHLRGVLFLLAAMLPITAITTVTNALLQRALKFRILGMNAFLSQLAYSISAVALAVAGMGVWSLVWSQMLQWCVDATLGLVAVRNQYRLEFSASGLRDVLSKGGMFTASKMLKWAAASADRIIVGRALGATSLGFYTRGTTLMRTARQLAGVGPMRVLFSSFAKIQHDPPRMRKGYSRSLSVSLIASALISSFVFVNAELIVRILLGSKWLSAVPVIRVLFIGFVAQSGAVVAETVPLAFGLGGAAALREGVQLVLVIVCAAAGAQFGVVGAAVGVCTAYWIFYVLCLVLVQRLLQPGWWEMMRLHLKSAVVILPPLAFSLGARWLFPEKNIFVQFVPAAFFGIAALGTLAVAPESLIGSDLVRARTYLRSALARLHWRVRLPRPEVRQ